MPNYRKGEREERKRKMEIERVTYIIFVNLSFFV